MQQSFAFFLRLQQHRGKRGRKGERVERGDDDRNGDRHRELLIQSPGNSGNERRRHEDRGKDQRDGDDRPGHFLHRLKCRIFRRKPVLDVMFDGFDDDDRIIDHETDGEHEAEERERVHREPEKREQRKRAEQRNGHGEQRDECRAPALQEDENHEDDEHQRLDERMLDLHHALRDGERGVQADDVFEVRREFLRQLLLRLLRAISSGDGVGAGELVERDQRGGLAVKLA